MDIRTSTLLVSLLLPVTAFATPIVNNDTRTVPRGVPITIDVLNNDSDSEAGVTLTVTGVSQPEVGTVTINSDGGITYTPAAGDTSASVQFTYTVTNNSELQESATGTVIINFSDQVIADIPDNDNQRSVALALDRVCNALADASVSDASAGRVRLAQQCEALLALTSIEGGSEVAQQVLEQISPEETLALGKIGSNASQMQTKLVGARMSQLGSGISTAAQGGLTWSAGRPLGGAAGDESLLSKWGMFASLQLEDADKDRTASEAGFDYSANSVAIGLDYALSSDWFVGSSVGMTMNDLDYKNKGGSVEADIYTFIAFSTFHRNNFSFDVQLGGGNSNVDVTRNINYTIPDYWSTKATTKGQTSGTQWFLSLQSQYSWSKDALTLFPVARLTHSGSRVKGYADNNADGWEVVLDDQKEQKTMLELSLQGTYAINTSWGVLIPSGEVNIFGTLASSKDDMQGYFAYAPRDIAGFTMAGEEADTLYYQLGLGSSIILPGGHSGYIGVRQTLGYEDYSATQLQASLRMEF